MPTPIIRWFRLTPGRLLAALLAGEGLLWLSERFGWPAWHKGYAVLTTVAVLAAVLVAMILWFAVALLFRRRFQFSIRSLLVLTVAVAIPFSWLAVEMKKAKEQAEAVEAIWLGQYDYQLDPSANEGEPLGPPWLRKLLGDDFFNNVSEAELDDETQVERLKTVPELRKLTLRFDNVTDAVLDNVTVLTQLEELELNGSGATDAGVDKLKALPQLRVLWLSGTRVTDAAMEHLDAWSRLEDLDLDGTRITDATLKRVTRLSRIKSLAIAKTAVTDAGLEELKSLPQLQELSLSSNLLTDSGIRILKLLPQLQELSVTDGNLTNTELKQLEGLTNLQTLNLDCDPRMKGLKEFQQALPQCEVRFPFFSICPLLP